MLFKTEFQKKRKGDVRHPPDVALKVCPDKATSHNHRPMVRLEEHEPGKAWGRKDIFLRV
jgi:hypothetical protein